MHTKQSKAGASMPVATNRGERASGETPRRPMPRWPAPAAAGFHAGLLDLSFMIHEDPIMDLTMSG